MSVTLTWGSANAAIAESINVYRSLTPMDVNALPTALATVAGSTTSYNDPTAVRNTVYYYIVGHVRAGQELLSPQLVQGHFPDSGPGPQTLLRGDWNLGYFGTLTPAQMTTPSLLNAVLPFTNVAGDGGITLWHKFVRKGKILFMPNGSFSSAQFWDLYKAGFIFGTNDNGSFPFALNSSAIQGYTGPYNQYKVMPIGAYSFIVRSLKASEKATSSYIAAVADSPGSEWSDLMGRLGLTSATWSPQDKWNDIAPTAANSSTFTQHFTSASYAAVVGNTNYFDVLSGTAISAGSYPQPGWLPVFELIP